MKKMNSYDIDRQLEPVLREIEKNGVKIDVDYLKKLSGEFDVKIKKLEREVFDEIGHEFNLNSPSQLADILYNKLKIRPIKSGIKKGKTHFSTGSMALEKISKKYPFAKKILRYREYSKLKNTYLDPLPKKTDENDRIHTHYAVDTATGRLSSKDPNLQNIPIRTEEGKKIRRAFIARDGYKLVKADYSQVELRIVAHLSGDEKMIETFKTGKDIHKATADMMGCDRRMAKVINFGVLYGMSAYGFAERLNVTPEEAQDFIDTYFITYPGMKRYIDDMIVRAKKEGFVETMYGRKREVSQLKSPIFKVRKFGERIAVNTPIQGTAAEIIKLAMLNLSNKQQVTSNKCKMILQVHDELVFEVRNDKIAEVIKKVKDVMENAVKLKVPLSVDIKAGENWQDTK